MFRNGKIKIQRCLDREDILRTAAKVSRLVWGAAICEVCKRPAIECASGRCGKCVVGKKTLDVEEIPAGELLEHAFGLASSGNKKRASYFAFHFTIETPKKEDARVGLAALDEFLRVQT